MCVGVKITPSHGVSPDEVLFLEPILGKSSTLPVGNYRELPNVSILDFVMMNVGVGHCRASACAEDCFFFFNGYNIY